MTSDTAVGSERGRTLVTVRRTVNEHGTMTVEDNIRLFTLPNSPFAFTGGADREEVLSIADRVELGDKLDAMPGSMPHADVRRLEIAKAVATEPDILLLDEPFAGLNQAEIRDLSEEIREFRDEGMTLVVVDHNMRGLMALVDRVIVLRCAPAALEEHIPRFQPGLGGPGRLRIFHAGQGCAGKQLLAFRPQAAAEPKLQPRHHVGGIAHQGPGGCRPDGPRSVCE